MSRLGRGWKIVLVGVIVIFGTEIGIIVGYAWALR